MANKGFVKLVTMITREHKGSVADPRANGASLSKLTESNLKSLSYEDRELIRRERRDGGEARGNEEREKRED